MATFSEMINGGKPVLVDFTAEWCGPCKMMKPILEDVKRKVGDQVTILKVDIDKNGKTASEFKIQSVPTLILFKNGQIKWRQSGLIDAGSLEKTISQFG